MTLRRDFKVKVPTLNFANSAKFRMGTVGLERRVRPSV
jgi:hypothetical protein